VDVWRHPVYPKDFGFLACAPRSLGGVAATSATPYLLVQSVTSLTATDLDCALAVLAEAATAEGAQPFDAPVVSRLRRLIPGDHVGYFEFSGGGLESGVGNTFLADEPVDAPRIFETDWLADAVRATIDSWALKDEYVCTSEQPLRLSDFHTRKELHRNPFYAEVLRALGVEHQLKVWLPAASGTVRAFFFIRTPGTRDFDERDRTILSVLRPHLAAIRERWERRHRPAHLTARETEVLDLVAQGLTTAEVAATLTISYTTARTHLENVFAKLGVHTRTAAVAWLRDSPAELPVRPPEADRN
jgi:DNA-binding CsgD family transcriptional regulator